MPGVGLVGAFGLNTKNGGLDDRAIPVQPLLQGDAEALLNDRFERVVLVFPALWEMIRNRV